MVRVPAKTESMGIWPGAEKASPPGRYVILYHVNVDFSRRKSGRVTDMAEAVRMEGIERHYRAGEGAVHALRRVDLQVEEGEFLTVVGRSGSGKSTLMNILGCLDPPDRGSYHLFGEDICRCREGRLSRIRNREIGFIFQGFNLLPGLTALENTALPLAYRHLSRREGLRRAEAALVQVGLGDRMTHRPSQLSGGQQQRVAIARALAANPRLLLADEPTGNLDSRSGEEVMALLRALSAEGRTIILITHDDRVARMGSRKMRMEDGILSPER